ncbi:tyrosine recombinase XerC [Lentilactobacillus senioris]|uniref:tyrosine recombinase XerC n=1 Tax=Lentilactobacillus senioris TaxID=931534 RepID=UPI0022808501|nr:tyrosine recombinase XerC [Lentilactobacillus senioris]MCY9806875.1 tyrosine recombinase XerC [Lentilactobacillus senioris]
MSKNEEQVNWFLKYLKSERQYSADTIRAYQEALKEFQQFLVISEDAEYKFTQVDQLAVEAYMSDLYDKDYAWNSISQKVSAMRSFYNFLEKNEEISINPFEFVQLKKHNNQLPRFFYQNELQELFQAAELNKDPQMRLRDQALLEVLYGTGIRVSECAGLTTQTVDLQQKVMLIQGKGNKQRYVPFGRYAQEALQNYYADSRRPVMTKNDQHHQAVFINHRGTALTARGIEYVLDQIVKRSSLTTSIHPHMLRHTYATDLLNNGADLRTVQELLGHSSLSSTQLYTHITKEHLLRDYNSFFPRTQTKK